MVARGPALDPRLPHGGQREFDFRDRAGRGGHGEGRLGRGQALHGRDGDFARGDGDLDDAGAVEEDAAAGAVEVGGAVVGNGRVTGFVDDAQAGGGKGPRGGAKYRVGFRPGFQAGANAQSRRPIQPFPYRDFDILNRSTGSRDPLQLHDFTIVRLGKVDPAPVGAPGRRERQPAPGEQHGGAGFPNAVDAQVPTLPGRVAENEVRPIGTHGRSGHGQDVARNEYSWFAAVARPQLDTVAAPLGEQHHVVGARHGLRPHLDACFGGDRHVLAGREVERPHVERTRLAGDVVQRPTVRGVGGVQVERGRVNGPQFLAGFHTEDHDPGVAVVVAHDGEPVAGRMPRRAGVEIAAVGELTGGAGLQVHDPDPAARREGDVPPVG